ncbi:histidine triad nucleotide-binding protein [Halioxenophilus aromaticivorans]|uniref:Histidine triad nucleotide-binding protein n=1 Tax=Halioxenophilus aromaticivorans TaxID=1306992 RepID=A0AAV3TYH4_9ALTE
MTEPTVFSKIIDGEIPAEKLYEDDDCICIKDIAPKAPTHVLLIPKKPIPRLVDATPEDQALLGKLMVTAGDIARELGVDDAFRLVINNGAGAGQTVFHLHLHILGNKKYTEDDGLGF